MSEIRPGLVRETFADWSGAKVRHKHDKDAPLTPAQLDAAWARREQHLGLYASGLDVEGYQVDVALTRARGQRDGLLDTNGSVTRRDLDRIFGEARDVLRRLGTTGGIGDGGVIHTQGGGRAGSTDAAHGANGVLSGSPAS